MKRVLGVDYIKRGMTYTPSSDDPVLVYRNGSFGFNYFNPDAREGFWENVKKFQKAFGKNKQTLT